LSSEIFFIRMPLSKDLHEFLELLNSNGVEYLVVGAFAVSYHGFPRYTADIDLFVRTSPNNAQRLLHVLSEFGFGSLGMNAEDLQTTDRVIQLGVRPNRIDLLTSISGVTYEEAGETRSPEGVPVSFIGLDALLRNKDSTGRAKDRGDAEELRKRK
jgi:hypothetical protein